MPQFPLWLGDSAVSLPCSHRWRTSGKWGFYLILKGKLKWKAWLSTQLSWRRLSDEPRVSGTPFIIVFFKGATCRLARCLCRLLINVDRFKFHITPFISDAVSARGFCARGRWFVWERGLLCAPPVSFCGIYLSLSLSTFHPVIL